MPAALVQWCFKLNANISILMANETANLLVFSRYKFTIYYYVQYLSLAC